MLRLGYLVSQLPAANHAYLLREIRTLRALGIEIHVASMRCPDRAAPAFTPDELDEAARTYYVKTSGLAGVFRAHLAALLRHPAGYLRGLACPLWMGRGDWRKTLYTFFYFVEAVLVGRWMEQSRLSHLHVHFVSLVGLIAERVFPITVSFTFHGPAEFWDPDASFLPEKIRRARFVCAISKYGRSQLMRICGHKDWEKVELTPLGVDPKAFRPGTFRRDPSPVEVLCVGRLSSEKAQHVLIEAVAELVKQGRDLRLRFVGDGPERQALEEHAAARGLGERARFEGWQDQQQLRRFYQGADIFVLPSFAEGLPVVLMEAMAMQLPCVTTQITGIPELIQDGRDGLLAPASDEKALAEAIARLMDDPELRRRLGEAARERVLGGYNLETNTIRLAEVFNRRLAGGKLSFAVERAEETVSTR